MYLTFTQLKGAMPHLLDMSTRPGQRLAIELQSAPGRGKSEFIASLIKSESQRTGQPWGFATCFLATMTPSDLLGFMIPTTDELGRPRSRFTMPSWFQTTDGKTVEDYPRGILFLDEYGQGEPDVKRASAELLLNGQLGPWRLPDGWTVIAASNRASDRSGVTKSFDFVINRRCEIHVMDSIEAWEEWAVGANVHPTIIAFAKSNPSVVFSDGVPDKQGPWCTPRSLVMAGNVLNAIRTPGDGMGDDELPATDVAKSLIHGLIGEAAGAQLFATIQLARELPKLENIIADPRGARLPDKPDARMLVCFTLAHRADADNAGNLMTYMERMPPEFTFSFAKAVLMRHPMLVAKSPEFRAYAQKNARVILASNTSA